MSKEFELLYEVKFNRYTNCIEDTVSDWDGVGDVFGAKVHYISTPTPFIIKESDIDYYRKFGGGFKSLRFAGYLLREKV